MKLLENRLQKTLEIHKLVKKSQKIKERQKIKAKKTQKKLHTRIEIPAGTKINYIFRMERVCPRN